MSIRVAEPLAPTATKAPERVVLAFAAALGEGDHAAATACFARDARLLTPDGTEVAGRERIREVLAQLTTLGSEIHFDSPRVLAVGPVALCSQRWKIGSSATGPEGFEQAFTCTTVLGRSAHTGRWQILIAAPWGT
jgi:ketosteroid isomerase-like protein